MISQRIYRVTRRRLAEMGFTLSKTQWGEYRLRPINAKPFDDSQDYFTADIDDALATARAEWLRATPPGYTRGTLINGKIVKVTG